MTKIAEITARRKAITPGVWNAEKFDDKCIVRAGQIVVCAVGNTGVQATEADARFIASAPSDIDLLLAELQRASMDTQRPAVLVVQAVIVMEVTTIGYMFMHLYQSVVTLSQPADAIVTGIFILATIWSATLFATGYGQIKKRA